MFLKRKPDNIKENKDTKEKKKKLTFKRTISNTIFVLKTVKKAAPGMLVIMLLVVMVQAATNFISDTYMLRYILNSFQAGKAVSDILFFVIIMAAITLIETLGSNALYNFYFYKKYMDITAYIERELFNKSREVELSCYEDPVFYDKYVKAMDEAPAKFSDDLDKLQGLAWTLVTMSANSFFLFLIDPVLIIFGLIPLLLGFLRKRQNELKHEYDSKSKTINRKKKYVNRTFYLNEYAKEIRLTTIGGFLFGMQKEALDEYKELIREYGWRKAFYKFIQNYGMQGFVILAAMLYSAYQTIVTGNMQVGDCLVVFNSISNVSYNLRYIVENLTEFQKNALYIEDYLKFMNYEPQIKNDGKQIAEPGEMKFENVSFRYAGAKDDLIKNVSFTIKSGEKIALVGQNGSGKSTLVKLMMRLYDPTAGRITLNGEDIRSISPDKYRELFGVVFQECRCFSMSVAENVLLRPLREGDDKIVTEALKQSGGYDKIASLKNGINTTLTREFDDEGTVLSGGELQKVELARIFAVPTPFVILDEPSSALDPIAEYKMFENMIHACEHRSSVFISHRLSSATIADHVLLIEDGRIAEEGTHRELMEKNGKYAGMFRMQAENYVEGKVRITEGGAAS
jgi:ATP-binding cassette subfamily B protein